MAHREQSLGNAIRQRRIELNLTQEELAQRIGEGVRQSDISRMERDRIQLPRAQRLRAIAYALELEPGELLVRAGWEGALAAVPPHAADPSVLDLPSPDAVTGEEPHAWEPFMVRDALDRTADPEQHQAIHERLHQALELSRATRLQLAETLDRSDQTARIWKQYYESRASRLKNR